ncbi:MAG: phage tail protein [Clostridia bacterium]|nr:phage tail protein [Clostridia bacterium]
MASAKIYSGLTAGIKLTQESAQDVAFLTGFELEISQEVFEAKTLGDKWTRKFPGIKTWSGSCEGLFTLDENQKKLFDQLLTDSADDGKVGIEMFFIVGDDKVLHGEAIVSELKVTVKADDKTEVSFSFEGVGEIQESTTV